MMCNDICAIFSSIFNSFCDHVVRMKKSLIKDVRPSRYDYDDDDDDEINDEECAGEE